MSLSVLLISSLGSNIVETSWVQHSCPVLKTPCYGVILVLYILQSFCPQFQDCPWVLGVGFALKIYQMWLGIPGSPFSASYLLWISVILYICILNTLMKVSGYEDTFLKIYLEFYFCLTEWLHYKSKCLLSGCYLHLCFCITQRPFVGLSNHSDCISGWLCKIEPISNDFNWKVFEEENMQILESLCPCLCLFLFPSPNVSLPIPTSAFSHSKFHLKKSPKFLTWLLTSGKWCHQKP